MAATKGSKKKSPKAAAKGPKKRSKKLVVRKQPVAPGAKPSPARTRTRARVRARERPWGVQEDERERPQKR